MAPWKSHGMWGTAVSLFTNGSSVKNLRIYVLLIALHR